MWKRLPFSQGVLFINTNVGSGFQLRTFLSDSFRCTEAWNKRLSSPLIMNTKLDTLHYELDYQFNHFGKAHPIDIDLLANAVTDDSHLDEVEDIVHRLRRSPETVNMLPSTHHAVIRLFLSLGDSNELLRILSDRLNYGIFPDNYCNMLMMDTFIKSQNYMKASKVAVNQMLQEDISDPVVKYMSLYSCHKYIKAPTPWQNVNEEQKEEVDDDEEEIKVRVKYLRNPFFDDHFDLVDPYHLIGKTFVMIGSSLPDVMGRTYQLIGLGLYNKWDQSKVFIEQCLNSKDSPIILKEGIVQFSESVEKIPTKEGDAGNSVEELKRELKLLIVKLESTGLVSEEDLLHLTENKLKDEIKCHEAKLIERQCQVYDEWDVHRQKLIDDKIEEIKREDRLAEVKRQKEALVRKEEELFFFDNENALDLEIEKKRPARERALKIKIRDKKAMEDEYIPPEIIKHRSEAT